MHHLPRIIHHLLITFLQCLMSLLPRQQSSTHHHLQSLHLTPLLITLQSTPHQLLQLMAMVLHHLVVTPMLLRPQYSMRRQQLLITTVTTTYWGYFAIQISSQTTKKDVSEISLLRTIILRKFLSFCDTITFVPVQSQVLRNSRT
jgi:hypothetical protein